MGAGASMDPMTSVSPYPTVEAALADGKSQGEIDAFLAVSPAAARAAARAATTVAPAPEGKHQQETKDAAATAAEATALPNKGQPPDPVLVMIEKRGGLVARLNHENEQTQVLVWLQLALPLTHASDQIKTWTEKLLVNDQFTSNMGYMEIFGPLQSSCKQELLRIGEPLSKLYIDQQYLQQLGKFMPPIHPKLQEQQSQQPNQKISLRQDHKLVGLVRSSTMNMETFIGNPNTFIPFVWWRML